MDILKTLFISLTLAALATSTVLDEYIDSSSVSTSVKTKTREGDVDNTPALTFFGKFNGEIVQCQKDLCEIFHRPSNDSIYSLHISGEYIYAGHYSGKILKCHLYTKHSCKLFYSAISGVWSMTSVRGHLIAGLDDLSGGTILVCDKQQANCQPLHKLGTTVTSLTHIGDSIYAGSSGLQVTRCSLTLNHCARVFGVSDDRKVTMAIASKDNIMFLLEHTGVLWKCSRSSNAIVNCVQVYLNTKGGYTWKMTAFNASLYVLGSSTGNCDVNTGNCESYTNQKEIRSVAMAYKTHHMLIQYKCEHKCEDEKCVPVPYYNENERAEFEVYVKDGRLYNANNTLVDTSNADQGSKGPAAKFIMAPEGKLFLSNHHQGIHTSSFLAGNPVSGAGEMVVENGVVRKIVACSKHYKPDLELNHQVVQSLVTQGYTEPIVTEMC